MRGTTNLKESIPEDVRRLAARLKEGGVRSWAVGGAVRDELLADLSNQTFTTNAITRSIANSIHLLEVRVDFEIWKTDEMTMTTTKR